jgi:hypothetical protein
MSSPRSSRLWFRARVVLVAVAAASATLAAACQSREPAPAETPTKPAPATAGATMEIVVNGVLVAQLNKGYLSGWPRLPSVLPAEARRMGSWQTLTIHGKGGPVELRRPADKHPDKIFVMFVGTDGTPGFAVMDPVDLARPVPPSDAITQVTKIELRTQSQADLGQNHHDEAEPVDLSALTIKVKTSTGTQVLTGTQLATTPREPPPNGDLDSKGWRLTTLLALAGAPTDHKLVLHAEDGTQLALEPSDLDETSSVPFLKLNRQGALRFRVFVRQGEGWTTTSDLRGVKSIDVLD